MRNALVSSFLVGGASSVMAAVPATVLTELGTMKTDALVVAAIVLVAIIAVAAFKFIRKGL